MTETKVDLVVNKFLSPEQFAQLVENGLIGENELSFVDDENEPYKGESGKDGRNGKDGLTASVTMNGETYTTDEDGNIPLGDVAVITDTPFSTNIYERGIYIAVPSIDGISSFLSDFGLGMKSENEELGIGYVKLELANAGGCLRYGITFNNGETTRSVALIGENLFICNHLTGGDANRKQIATLDDITSAITGALEGSY